AAVPAEGAGGPTATLRLPRPEGGVEEFRLVSYPLLPPPLAAHWSGIRTYHGYSLRDPLVRLRLDWTYAGLRAMVWDPAGIWLIDPRYWGDRTHYISYYKADYPAPSDFTCEMEAEKRDAPDVTDPASQALNGDCQLRSYRLALACTGEYAQYHFNNQSPGGLTAEQAAAAAMVTSLNRVNGIYEAELAIRLVLVANNNLLIYTNGSTDPYTNNSGSTMLNENQANIDGLIGSANYDMGHVFSTGGGGIASLNSPCRSSYKARGVTGRSAPVGDAFDVDYVAHEMGHQFGANHTQNNDCNRRYPYSMEPGSASTIMGYAGICSPNVQSNSDAYYHGISLEEIAGYMEGGSGNNCATIVSSANTAPSITQEQDYTLPAGTPFVLTGTATDADGDPLTYCWEQWDYEVGTPMPPQPTNTLGPTFRSLTPVSSPQRYFPPFDDVLNGTTSTWEVLPTVSRNMIFNLTVRDFHTDAPNSYGCNVFDEINLTLDDSNGPFTVTDPLTGTTWSEGQTAQVQWAVAGTNVAPISSPQVDILLSTDGGQNFSTLATGVTNDGYATVTVPAGTTSQARILVRGNGHIFYNVSEADFTIGSASGGADYTLTALNNTASGCGVVTYRLQTGSVGGVGSQSISFAVSGLPAGASATFDPTTVTPGGLTTLTISGLDMVTAGTYGLTVNATSTLGSRSVGLTLVVTNPNSTLTLTPGDGVTGQDIKPSLSVDALAGATNYELQLSTNAGFSSLLVNQSGTERTFVADDYILQPATTYYWRARATTDCGTTPWTTYAFSTGDCYIYSSTDVPVSISSMGANTVTSTLSIPAQGTVADVDLYQMQIDHTYISDLEVRLVAPTSGSVLLIDNICSNQSNMAWSLDDEATLSTYSCPPVDGAFHQPPSNALSAFDGTSVGGNWTLEVADLLNLDGGSLNQWSLKVCIDNYALLPVRWLSFTARPADDEIVLDWRTAAEQENEGFTIERRSEWEERFEPVGWVDGAGDTDEEQAYQWTDRQVEAGVTYYYRLEQRDWDGALAYSPLRSARLPLRAPGVHLFPNPTDGQVRLRVDGLNGQIQGRLMEAHGRTMLTFSLPAGADHPLNLEAIPAGVYWLQLQHQDWTQTVRLVRY
ncbi:MAG: proprotein convertase P-domain-containing protein, partial [Lewinella sp.]|nr:proprotein convertase P-domain-containing protein [Lewinella sp.]